MNSSVKGNLIALFTVMVWGTTFITTKILLKEFTPVEILFTRFILGLAALTLAYPRRLKGLSAKQELMLAGARAYLFYSAGLRETRSHGVRPPLRYRC